MNSSKILSPMPRIIDLTYCTNVHALGTPEIWKETLGFFGPHLRDQLGWKQMPMGLWWQATLAETMALSPQAMADFLTSIGVTAFTCNGFPYGDFHEAVVKTKVYQPDWTTPERLHYTQKCAELMAALRPSDNLVSLSTLPLGWRHFLGPDQMSLAATNLIAYALFARSLEEKTGIRVALGIEPEPGCTLERIPQVLNFWNTHLRPAAKGQLDAADLGRYLGLCYDTCHQAVQFESATDSLRALQNEGISIHKMQLSSALQFKPDNHADKPSLSTRLAFAEPKFLHQTRIAKDWQPNKNATHLEVQDFDDLPEALAQGDLKQVWRTHYHLPLQAESLVNNAYVGTTRADMLEAYHFALKEGLCSHFEVETYTWSVLPETERPQTPEALAQALAREIQFVVDATPSNFKFRHDS